MENLGKYISTYEINSNGFIGKIYEFVFFYLIMLQTTKSFQNEVVTVTHNVNIIMPKGFYSIGLPPVTDGKCTSQNVKIGWRSFEIIFSQMVAPTAYLNAYLPKFIY